jgi:hypothetical protein
MPFKSLSNGRGEGYSYRTLSGSIQLLGFARLVDDTVDEAMGLLLDRFATILFWSSRHRFRS